MIFMGAEDPGEVINGTYYPPTEPQISPIDTIDIVDGSNEIAGTVDENGHAV